MTGRRAEQISDGLQCAGFETHVCRDWLRSRVFAVLIFLAGLSPLGASAETASERIDRVKAAFVLNIARFVSWPDEVLDHQGGVLLLCLYRSNPFGEAMKSIAGKTVNGRSLQIKPVKSLTDSKTCNILLIGGDHLTNFGDESPHGSNGPLLTIADLTDAVGLRSRHHALVALVRNGARIGFEINLKKARSAGLQMSSNLLKLAKIVED
ncbi:MAG: YfiR family protein [Gammaproteobacteria bacterium]